MSSDEQDDPTDAQLVQGSLSGESRAFAILVHRWSARVLAICHSRVRCRHSAEDLAQETLLRGMQALSTLTAPDKFGPWLRGIAHRVCLDWLKAKQTSQVPFSVLATRDEADPHDAVSLRAPSEKLEFEEDICDLLTEVGSLPDDYRETLMLFYYDDLSYRQIADLLGVSSATVNARLTKARAKLRERLGHLRRSP